MSRAQPFIKWAGGKRQILPAILQRLPEEIATYYEPFLGGGAVFFALDAEDAFDRAVVGDNNPELMNTYSTLSKAAELEEVISLLKGYPYEVEFFNSMRKKHPKDLSQVERAARFLYLNKTCFNGLYRVNKAGLFNVPFGKYTNPNICDEGNLREAHSALQRRVSFSQLDFEEQVAGAVSGDTVYFDPPYMPLSETANFTEYMAGGFDLPEHQRLAACFRGLAERGVKVLLSNSDTPEVRALYVGFQIDTVSAKRNINSDGDKRGFVSEVLVMANL